MSEVHLKCKVSVTKFGRWGRYWHLHTTGKVTNSLNMGFFHKNIKDFILNSWFMFEKSRFLKNAAISMPAACTIKSGRLTFCPDPKERPCETAQYFPHLWEASLLKCISLVAHLRKATALFNYGHYPNYFGVGSPQIHWLHGTPCQVIDVVSYVIHPCK